MSEIRFQSKWFEKCLRDYLNIEGRPITDEDVVEIKYLFVSTTHGYELGFAKSLPPELFQTCAFPDSGDEWYFACIENTGKYSSIQDFLEIEVSNLEIGYQVHELRFKDDTPRFAYRGSAVDYKLAQRAMRSFDAGVKRYGTQDTDFEGLMEDEITCDYGILSPEDFSCLTGLEVLRLMSCQTEIHSLSFLEHLPRLRVLEIGEVFLNDLAGLDKLIGLEKLCIWIQPTGFSTFVYDIDGNQHSGII